jgi:hypothetical protein
LNTSALPNRPDVVHVVLVSVPLLPRPEASFTALPEPSSNPYAATSVLADCVVALAVFVYAPKLLAASVALTRKL